MDALPQTRASARSDQVEEFSFRENRELELLRLLGLRAGIGTDDDVVDVLRDARRYGAAQPLDAGARLVAAHRVEAAGEDEALAVELSGAPPLHARLDARLEQPPDLVAVSRLGEELVDRV